MQNNYMNTWATIMNICKRFAAENPSYALSTFDFDSNVAEAQYPDGNLIGPYKFTYAEEGTLITCGCSITLGVTADVDIIDLNEMTGKLVNFINMQTRHPLMSYSTNTPVGLMVAMDSLSVEPVTRTTNRQFRFVLQEFGLDQATRLQGVSP